VFLAGLVILWRVMNRCQANELRYTAGAVRNGMVLRLLRGGTSESGFSR
jgi:exopolyphosphatase/pppGpp-phosphohydrolase